MPYVVRLTPPNGAPEYLPDGFGYTVHAHATDLAEAKRFPTTQKAWQRANGYTNPAAFWESERRHQKLMRERFARWHVEVIEIES